MLEELRQKLIVRQSCMKLAVRLLISEQELSNSGTTIPIGSIKMLTNDLEEFVFELDNEQQEPEKKGLL